MAVKFDRLFLRRGPTFIDRILGGINFDFLRAFKIASKINILKRCVFDAKNILVESWRALFRYEFLNEENTFRNFFLNHSGRDPIRAKDRRREIVCLLAAIEVKFYLFSAIEGTFASLVSLWRMRLRSHGPNYLFLIFHI